MFAGAYIKCSITFLNIKIYKLLKKVFSLRNHVLREPKGKKKE